MEASPLQIPGLIANAVDGGALPPRPGPALDPYLDATESCVRRFGWSRTSPQDIAREAGVNRTTIYRVLGAKNEIFRLLVAREVHRLIDRAVLHAANVQAREAQGVEAIVELTATAIEQVHDNPTFAKLIAHEPEMVADFMQRGMPGMLARFTEFLSPILAIGMKRGALAERDPQLMTEWVVRMALSLLFAPPRVGLREFLAAGIRPLLEVGSASR